MKKIRELNLDLEGVEYRNTIDVDEFNKNIESLANTMKYFKSIGVFSVDLWTGYKPKITVQAYEDKALKNYLNAYESVVVSIRPTHIRHSVKKGDLEILYIKDVKFDDYKRKAD